MKEHPDKKEQAQYESLVRAATGKKQKPIHIKESHKGKLHEDLGVPKGEKIPAKKLERAKADASPAEKKRIVFAENSKRWSRG